VQEKHRVLVLGASYGSVLASKLLLAGHDVELVCLPEEVRLINGEGTRVRLPVRGVPNLVELDSRNLPGRLSAQSPEATNPTTFDLVALAMQEPQYRSSSVKALLQKIAKAELPCMSIMNIPPLPYLARIPGLDAELYRDCYTDATVWDDFNPACITLCSPDPQAFRPPDAKGNVLQVSLPTNFRAARFVSDTHTSILKRLEADIQSSTINVGTAALELPVKLRVFESVFLPLAKWSMLMTGNYRCIQPESTLSIKDAVTKDIDRSRSIYNWVGDVCELLGAAEADRTPFDKYLGAARFLERPSSAARAIAAGATNIERLDKLVRNIAAHRGMHNEDVDRVVALVDSKLDANRRDAAQAPTMQGPAR
jgi:hypothetical protein